MAFAMGEEGCDGESGLEKCKGGGFSGGRSQARGIIRDPVLETEVLEEAPLLGRLELNVPQP